jgi:hypothetical protein
VPHVYAVINPGKTGQDFGGGSESTPIYGHLHSSNLQGGHWAKSIRFSQGLRSSNRSLLERTP